MIDRWYSVTSVNPEPWQASLGSVGRKGGKLYVAFHKPPQLRGYQEALKDEFVKQNPTAELYDEELDVTFYFWRELAQFDTGIKKSRAHYADATNLMKSTEDALQGILYKNDRIIRASQAIIVEQTADTIPGILVHVKSFSYVSVIDATVRMSDILVNTPIITEPSRNVDGIF